MGLEGYGKAELYRARGQQIVSLSRWAFAQDPGGAVPVIKTSKGEILFGSRGVGAYPMVIVGPWGDVKKTFGKHTGVYCAIEVDLGDNADVGGEDGFTLCVKASNYKEAKLVIHNAGKDAMIALVSAAGGFAGGGFSSGFAGNVNEGASLFKDFQESAIVLSSGRKEKKKHKPKKEMKDSALVAITVHYLPIKGAVDTGKQRVSFWELRGAACQAVALL